MKSKLAAARKLIVVSLLYALLGIVLFAAGFLVFSPVLQVREIRIARTDPRIDIEQVQQALSGIFGARMLFLSSQEIEQRIMESIPDVSSVSMRKEYPSSIIVNMTLDPIIAKLRIADPDSLELEEDEDFVQYDYVTENGMYVLQTSMQAGSGAELPLIQIVDWGVRPSPWSTVIEPEILRMMERAEQELREQFGQEVLERTVFLRGREFHLETQDTEIWFDIRSSLAEQLQRFRVFLQAVGLENAPAYIDLRLKDRVIYR